jgi:hypothetical protein
VLTIEVLTIEVLIVEVLTKRDMVMVCLGGGGGVRRDKEARRQR